MRHDGEVILVVACQLPRSAPGAGHQPLCGARRLSEYECFISAIVVDELAEGDYPHKDDCLTLVNRLRRLEVNEDVLRIAEIYWTRKLMPRAPVRDALHLAIGSYFHMDVILTWNCQHLANANKTRHLTTLNRLLNLEVPQVVTPFQLQRQED